MSRAGISYEEVSELDLESIKHLKDAELPGFFAEIAERASVAQLQRFLFDALPGGESAIEDPEVKLGLVSLYVDRRVEGVRRMRDPSKAFREFYDLMGK